eukprot:75278_1
MTPVQSRKLDGNMNGVLLCKRAGKYSNGLMLRPMLSSISVMSVSPYSLNCIGKRNFKLGLGSEWTKEQRTALEFKLAQSGQPMDFSNPLTYIGLVAPMFAWVYCGFFIWRLYFEKTDEEEAKQNQVIKAITHRDPKLRVDDL